MSCPLYPKLSDTLPGAWRLCDLCLGLAIQCTNSSFYFGFHITKILHVLPFLRSAISIQLSAYLVVTLPNLPTESKAFTL